MKNKILLVCTECLQSNYKSTKSGDQRIEVKKYCSNCNKHTIHKENK